MSLDSPQLPPEEPDVALGQVVQRLREEQGMSQADLADRSGVDRALLAKVEGGTVDPPWTAVEAIADGLGVSIQSLASAVSAQDADAP